MRTSRITWASNARKLLRSIGDSIDFLVDLDEASVVRRVVRALQREYRRGFNDGAEWMRKRAVQPAAPETRHA